MCRPLYLLFLSFPSPLLFLSTTISLFNSFHQTKSCFYSFGGSQSLCFQRFIILEEKFSEDKNHEFESHLQQPWRLGEPFKILYTGIFRVILVIHYKLKFIKNRDVDFSGLCYSWDRRFWGCERYLSRTESRQRWVSVNSRPLGEGYLSRTVNICLIVMKKK